jgi:D-alanine transaminase
MAMFKKRISFLNDKFIDHQKAFVHIEDRGFQFGDGIYEVILFNNGKIIDLKWHLDRLYRSLKEVKIDFFVSEMEITGIILQLFKKNKLKNGYVYLQVTRGQAFRSLAFPSDITPTFIVSVCDLEQPSEQILQKVINNNNKFDPDFASNYNVVTHPDLRWLRCDVKSVNLLASTMIKQKSSEMGAIDAILIRDDFITEATFANVFIVDSSNSIITKDADNFILQGITRNRIINLASQYNIKTVERKFSYQELISAKEIFLTGTITLIRPVLMVDNKIIGDGRVGEITKKIAGYYLDFLSAQNS